jgi:phosphatidylinositol alpha-1,6-mannosyltransferase
MQILMLLSDGFGGFGGISQFNRDFLTALDASPIVERVNAYPRLILTPITATLPEAVIYERRFATGKLKYAIFLIGKLLWGRRPDLVICAHINLLPAAWIIARLRRARLALVIHGIDAWRPHRSFIVNLLTRKVDGLLAVSNVTARRFLSWSRLPESRCTILHNCVDLKAFTPGPRSERLVSRYGLEGARILLTMGRLASEGRSKGFDEVLEAMPAVLRRFPDAKYLIVGDGADAPRLKEKARKLGLCKSVVFAGRVAEDEKVDHFRLADVYVMPSAGEGFGIVLIEAAACGIPIIGSKVDGSREALLEGRLGVLVDPTDQNQILASIFKILSRRTPFIRNPAIEEYSVRSYQGKVADWLESQNRSHAR